MSSRTAQTARDLTQADGFFACVIEHHGEIPRLLSRLGDDAAVTQVGTPHPHGSVHSLVYKLPDLAILPVPMDLLINILTGLYVCVTVLMMLVILMQRPKSEGLGAAFGGGVTENIFGAQTTNVLTKITGWLAAFFFILTFVLSILYAHKGNSSSNLRRELIQGLPPPAAATASPTPSPGPSSAVGPPGTVTNPTPGTTGPAPSVKPADLAVGAVPPASSMVSPVASPAASTKPSAAASATTKPKP